MSFDILWECIAWLLSLFWIVIDRIVPAIEGSNHEFLAIGGSDADTTDLTIFMRPFEYQNVHPLPNLYDADLEISPSFKKLLTNSNPSPPNNTELAISTLTQRGSSDFVFKFRLKRWLVLLFASHCFMRVVIQLKRFYGVWKAKRIEREMAEMEELRKLAAAAAEAETKDDKDIKLKLYSPDGKACLLQCQLIEESDDISL